MWAFVVGGSKGWRVPPPSSPFESMANGMHGNVDVGHTFPLFLSFVISTIYLAISRAKPLQA